MRIRYPAPSGCGVEYMLYGILMVGPSAVPASSTSVITSPETPVGTQKLFPSGPGRAGPLSASAFSSGRAGSASGTR